MNIKNIPKKTIERFCLYRRILQAERINEYIFSYELANSAHIKPDLVRRDLMWLENSYSTSKGYKVTDLVKEINNILNSNEPQKMALIGIGNMGRAFINYFKGRGNNMEITAAFDNDKSKINRVIGTCKCYHIDELKEIVNKENITIGIITVPETEAQNSANLLADSGIKAILNVAHVPIKCPIDIYIENLDLTSFFEKTAYYAKLYNKN